MTPLERAARALTARYRRDAEFPDAEPTLAGYAWDQMSDRERVPYLRQARAVITAIREPSEAQDRAAAECDSSYVGDVYTAMIDQLLAEGE